MRAWDNDDQGWLMITDPTNSNAFWQEFMSSYCMVNILQKEKEVIQKSMKEEASSVLTTKQQATADEDDWLPTPAPAPAAAAAKKQKSSRRSKVLQLIRGWMSTSKNNYHTKLDHNIFLYVQQLQKKAETNTRRKRTTKQARNPVSSDEDEESEDVEPQQCFWYHCVNTARPGSKYCSDDCGIRISTDRILRV